jgi:hypothetical protein
MKTKIIYSENFEGSTLWVKNEEFACIGSFIRKNESGKTFTACLNDNILGEKFRTPYGAKRAMQKFANSL